MNVSESPILISLKPHYADLIFKGLKRAELRRRDLTRMEGRDVFIYVTSPVRKLQGGFHVGKVLTGTPEEIWDEVSEGRTRRQTGLRCLLLRSGACLRSEDHGRMGV